jgi:hypothetical protein
MDIGKGDGWGTAPMKGRKKMRTITFYNENRVFCTHKVDDLEYMEYKADLSCLDLYFRITEAIVKYSFHGEEANKLWNI